MLRRLDRNVIRNSRCRIGPEVRRDLPGRAQAYINVIGDALRAQPELQSTRTIDRGHECRTIDLLLKMRVDDARNCGNTPPQLLRYAQVRSEERRVGKECVSRGWVDGERQIRYG